MLTRDMLIKLVYYSLLYNVYDTAIERIIPIGRLENLCCHSFPFTGWSSTYESRWSEH